MARIVNEQEYAGRRREILDAAQRLVFTRGYEQMTIQDVISVLKISKGAFYHYFDSKQDLLEALIENMMFEAEAFLFPILDDPDLPALKKFSSFFNTIALWKTARKSFILTLMRVWYMDENAVVRQKVNLISMQRYPALLERIVRQGTTEGVFQTRYPDQTSVVALAIINSLGEYITHFFLGAQVAPDAFEQIERSVAAHTEALERILGAPPGSLVLMDTAMIHAWIEDEPDTSERSE